MMLEYRKKAARRNLRNGLISTVVCIADIAAFLLLLGTKGNDPNFLNAMLGFVGFCSFVCMFVFPAEYRNTIKYDNWMRKTGRAHWADEFELDQILAEREQRRREIMSSGEATDVFGRKFGKNSAFYFIGDTLVFGEKCLLYMHNEKGGRYCAAL